MKNKNILEDEIEAYNEKNNREGGIKKKQSKLIKKLRAIGAISSLCLMGYGLYGIMQDSQANKYPIEYGIGLIGLAASVVGSRKKGSERDKYGRPQFNRWGQRRW